MTKLELLNFVLNCMVSKYERFRKLQGSRNTLYMYIIYWDIETDKMHFFSMEAWVAPKTASIVL